MAVSDIIRQSIGDEKKCMQCDCMPSCTSISYDVDVANTIENISLIDDYLKLLNINLNM